jgi:4a-hydroxytetrahydrobiopterin dehydratase
MPTILDQGAIEEALKLAPGWVQTPDGALLLDLTLPSAALAIGFIAAVGALAEKHGHHPELGWVYRRVTLRLCTHDAGDAITELDRDLMAAIAVMQSALR